MISCGGFSGFCLIFVSQAFVQFYDLESAQEAREHSNNTAILKEGIMVNVHFSKMENLVAKGDNIDFVAFDEQAQIHHHEVIFPYVEADPLC